MQNNVRLIIFGLNNLSEMMCYNLENSGCIIEAFTVNQQYIKEETFCRKKIVPFENIEKYYSPSEFQFCLCIGYTKMNLIRKNIFIEIKKKGYKVINYVHPNAFINNAVIGEGNIILENAILGFNSTLGDGNIVYPNAQIAHHTKVGDFNFFAISSSVAGSCKVKNNCFFGNNSCTKNNLSFEDQTLIGAGTYISVNTEKNGVYVLPKSYKLKKSSFDFY